MAAIVVVAVGGLAWYLTHRPPLPPEGMAPFGGAASAGAFGQRHASGAASGAMAGGGGAGAGRAGGRGGPPSTVGVARARHAQIPVIIDALGTVTSAASVIVTPQVSGVITGVLYKEGQLVRKGQVLATIDPKPFQAALDQAIGARERDTAQLDAARLQLERYKTLQQQDSIAGQTVDTQAALAQQLVGTVAVDRANEDTARLNLGWTRIVAPVTGRVGLRPIDAGNYIAAGNSTGVATITQVAPIDVAFSIPQERVPEILQRQKAGATLPVTAWDSARTRQLDAGSFSTLDNQIDTQTGTVKSKARFANEGGLLFPNQFVNVRLLLRKVDAAVVVPVTALRHGPSGDYVYVVSPERVVAQRAVTAGLSGADDVAIDTGLAAGELVVTEGGDRLKDGSRVQTAADRPASGASGAYGAFGTRGGHGGYPGQHPGAASAASAPGAWPGHASDAAAGSSVSPVSPVSQVSTATPAPALPTAEQRKKMLDAVKDDPEQLARRQRFLDALDRGDPAALQRWQQIAARRQEGQ